MSEAFARAVTALREYAAGYAAGEGCEEPPDRAWCATMVRAVLAAIREPDAALRKIGFDKCNVEPGYLSELDVADAWQTMIDEVLRDV